jgi:hypothetical protein
VTLFVCRPLFVAMANPFSEMPTAPCVITNALKLTILDFHRLVRKGRFEAGDTQLSTPPQGCPNTSRLSSDTI